MAKIHMKFSPRSTGGRQLRLAVLAPPWIPVPPEGYGGVEAVVAMLCDGLVRRGHDVTLFAAPGSRSSATVREVLPRCYPDEIERSLYEVDHVARVFDAVDAAAASGGGFDIVHDHCGFAAFAMAHRLDVPLVHTLHGPFTAETSDFYRHHGWKANVVAISRAQLRTAPPGLRVAGVVPNPIDVASWPYQPDKKNYLLWLGRLCEAKGPHTAIAVAAQAELPLVLAGPIQPAQHQFFDEQIAPHVDGERVRYAGEVATDVKKRLFADARALLMPIRWDEPFGMVMVEALTCGTPVIAFGEGAAPEIVRDGVTGLIVSDEVGMVAAVSRLDSIDPADCRADMLERFDVDRVTAGYEAVYATVMADATRAGRAQLARPSAALSLPASIVT